MNQLSQFAQQMRTLFMGMTPQSRLMSVLLTLGILVSSVFLVQGYTNGNGSMVYLFDGKPLSDPELDKIEIAFSVGGLRRYERNGNRIRIPSASKDEYLKAIFVGKAVPEGMGSSVEAGLSGGSFLESSKTTEARIASAKLKEIANTLKQMNQFILDANVLYDERREGFSSERKQTASIAIKTKNGKRLTRAQKDGIMAYVEKSFAGLKHGDIALLDLSDANTVVPQDDPTSKATTQFYETKRQREEEFRARAEQLLADYGDIRLDVNVELDPVLRENVEQLNFNEKPTNIQSTTTKKDAKSKRPIPSGRPGTETNVVSNERASLSDQTNDSKETTENLKNVTGNTLTLTERAGLQTKRVAFTVSVPFSYYRKAALHRWQELNPGKAISEAPEFKEPELKSIIADTDTSIKNKLTPLLPPGLPGEDKFPRVSVDFHYDIPVPEFTGPSMTQVAMSWLAQSWQTLALMGLVGVALISLRSFAKSNSPSNDSDFERGFDLPLDDATDIDLSSLTDEESDLFVDKSDNEPSTPRLRTSGGEMKSDLTTLVRENPDAAATLLRNWISGGAG
jgi:flagellar M-ring protein FliF